MFEFKLPDVGEGIHEGEIVNWLVEEGEHVDEDQDIVEVMTDKATVQISSPVAGTIQERVYAEGEVVDVGEVFVIISPDDGAQDIETAEEAADVPAPEQGPSNAPEAKPQTTVSTGARSNGGEGAEVLRRRTPEGVLAPPRVRIEARKRGIDIAAVDGSGPAGRVSMEDLDAHATGAEPERAPAGTAGAAGGRLADRFDLDLPSVDREDAREIVPLGAPAGSTRASAHRATTLQPHFTHVVTVRADDLQEALASAADQDEGLELSPVAAVAKALAIALEDHPRLNALVDEHEDELVQFERVNVAVAWPTEDGHELRTVADAGRKGLIEIQRTVLDGGEDVQATVTVATLDDEDGFVSTPVLDHPQVTGLVLGSVTETAVLDEGQIRPGREMNLAFSFDHRWIDGYDGALLAEDIERLLSNPESMLLG